MAAIEELIPTGKSRVMDIVASLGIDVTSWGNFKGGQLRAAANPKFCYEWSFDEADDFIIANFWTHQLSEENGQVLWHRDIKDFSQTGLPLQRERGRRLEAALKRAYHDGLPVHVIICHGDRRRDGGRTKLKARGLDPELWAVKSYDASSGYFTIVRSQTASKSANVIEDEASFLGFEGQEKLRWFVRHRHRESSLGKAKIARVMQQNGNLACEVPRCGFDFVATYGDLGVGFAHVHHKNPLSASPLTGHNVSLDDLAVVCANCHCMIHRGGECRELAEIIPQH